ncbi:MAG: N-acetylmuramoyl-L-alanine amidase family protein [Lachnospiraceae bacterium]|nr:N-acetylmuramoyl-L-alanine amidase family protein [Lachnospiraceae bacterium]
MFIKKFRKALFISTLIATSGLFNTSIFAGNTVNMTLNYDGKAHAYYAEEIKINVLGKELTEFVVPPVSIDGRTLVPARAICESMGADIKWNGETKEVYIIKDPNVIVLKIDSATGIKNGVNFSMDVAPKIINDSTMLPARYLAEALDLYVGWDDASRTVSISETDTSSSVTTTTPTTTSTSESISITRVSYGSDKLAANTFTISASGEISKFENFKLNNDRIVVDIYNATMAISSKNIPFDGNPYISAIRSAQNQTEPEKITRVVFDLNLDIAYTAVLSSDKKSIIVSFGENTITSLTTNNKNKTDYITIKGKTVPAVSISTLSSPDRIVIDMPNSTSSLKSSYSASSLNFVSSITTSQFSDSVVRVVLNVNAGYDYEVETDEDSTSILVYKCTVENISYSESNHQFTLAKPDNLDIDYIIHTDDYLNGEYILTLPGDFTDTYGYGRYKINDDYFVNLLLSTESGNTTITFLQSRILCYEINEDKDNIYIDIKTPKEYYDKVVLIDPGHGGSDPGSTSLHSITEKELNLDIAKRVMSYFENDTAVKAYITRTTDVSVPNYYRAEMGNESADLFVSIHCNASIGGSGKGTEVLYLEHENEASGYLTSKIAAQFMQNYITSAAGTTDRGIKRDPNLIVLNQSTIPSILVETAFLTNEEDAAKLESDYYREIIAKAIYSSISDMMNQYKLKK